MSTFHQKIKAKQIDTDDLGKIFLRKYIYYATIQANINWIEDTNSGFYIQLLEVDGIQPEDNPEIFPTRSGNKETDDLILESWFEIDRITTSNNSLTVYSTTNNLSSTIPITIICYRKSQ